MEASNKKTKLLVLVVFAVVSGCFGSATEADCEDWQSAVSDYHSCDPAGFPLLKGDVECVSNKELMKVAPEYSVAACAKKIEMHTEPCRYLSARDRVVCGQMVLGIEAEIVPE